MGAKGTGRTNWEDPVQVRAYRRAASQRYREKNPERVKELARINAAKKTKKPKTEAQRAYHSEYYKKYYATNRERIRISTRDSQLKCRYGLTVETRDALLTSQNGACPICASEIAFPGSPSEGKRRAVVDHCHKTGKVRGVLCSEDNAVLGLGGDSVDTLRAAIAYLERSRG